MDPPWQEMEHTRRKRVDEFFSARKRRYQDSEPLPVINKSRPSPIKKPLCTKMDVSLEYTEKQAEFGIEDPSMHKENKETRNSFCNRRISTGIPVVSDSSEGQSEALDACNKRNSEIECSHDVKHKPFSLRCCSQETLYAHHSETTLTLGRELAPVQDEGRKDVTEVSPMELHKSIRDSESKNSDGGLCQKDTIFEEEKHNYELSQFANDFLSICCSGVVSTKVTNPSKSSGTPTHKSEENLVGNDAKTDGNDVRVCTAQVHDISMVQNEEKINCNIYSMKIYDPKFTEENGETEIPIDVSAKSPYELNTVEVFISSKPLEASGNATVAVGNFESPKVANEANSLSLSVDKRKFDGTPQSNSGGGQKQGLQWSAGSSLFSPGDEFWDEAIHWADALVLPKVNDIVDIKPDGRTEKIEVRTENLIYHRRASSHTSKNSIGNSESKAGTPQLNAGPSASRNIHGRAIYYDEAEVSPLPVRRFDFTISDGVSDHVDISVEDDPRGKLLVQSATKSDLEDSMKSQSILNVKGKIIQGDTMANNMAKEISETSKSTSNLSQSVSAGADIPVVKGALDASSLSDKTDNAGIKLELRNWLPDVVCSVYAKKGLQKLYPWQVECLQLNGVLDGRNLVYCASTSAGKSLVAEVLMLRKVLTTGKKALLVLPYVSICHEKEAHLTSVLEPLGKKVSSFFGASGGASLPNDSSIAVCTIEKANSLINKLLEEARLPELALVVIDELHMVGDKDRGYLLELILTKLRYVAGEGNDITSEISEGKKYGGLQIVGMSATMPNAAAVSTWLQAALYQTEFRPVPLIEHIKVSNVIYNKDMEIVRRIRKGADLAGKDPDHIVELCNEVVQEGHSVLLFCSSRKACETSAKHVAKFLPDHTIALRSTIIGPESASAALEELQKCPAGLDPVLAETLPRGVAYHHAGLTVEEREIVESCYRSGIVRILTATSTLAAGVNLPAQRVIFRQPRIGRDFIDGTRYRQMAGRAGRAGIDTSGESILICKSDELKRMSGLLNEGCQPLLSCLAEDKNGMTRAILEVVAGGIVQTANDVERYVKCTLLNSTQTFQEVVKSAQDSLYWLCHRKFLEWDRTTELYSCTPLGKAAFGSSLSPEESLIVFEDLAKAREGFVLASDLHLVYQVTPIYVDLEPDWNLFYKKFSELSPMDQAVGNRVGVMEPFLMRMAHGALTIDSRIMKKSPRRRNSPILRGTGKKSPTKAVEQTLRVCKRFFVALILAKLVQEAPLMEICESFKVSRGMVQSLQENSGRFASMVSSFCERLGWHDLEGLVSKFQSRVSFGVRAEIVELAEIPYVKASRARALYKAGLRTPQSVAEATIPELLKALFDTSSRGPEDGSNTVMKHRMYIGMARRIQNGARKLVLEQAEAARIAAFSALRSLGIDVPAGLSQSLAENSALARKQMELDKTSSDRIQIEMKEDSMKESGLSVINEFPNDPKIHSVPDPQSIDVLHGQHTSHTYKNHQDETVFNHGINMGPVDVDEMNGGFDQFFSIWQDKGIFFFDLHFSPCMDSASPCMDVKGIAICWMGSPIYYVKFWDVCSSKNNQQVLESLYVQAKDRWKKLETIFSKKGVAKITWNLQSQTAAFQNPSLCLVPGVIGERVYGIFEPGTMNRQMFHLQELKLAEPLVDLKIAAWLLWPDEESSHNLSLEQEVKKRLPGHIVAEANRDGRWINQMDQVAHNGCCRRASQIRALYSIIWKLLIAEGLEQPLLQQEMPLVSILSKMETYGVRVDMEGCKSAREHLENKIKQLEAKAHELTGVAFSLSVPGEVANVLYTHLKLPVPTGCHKGKLHPSTDKQALDALMDHHPIVEVIKEHRTLSKILNGTLGSILHKARPIVTENTQTDSGKSIIYHVKGHWLQTSTATGRLSMEEPNLQCVEHPLHFSIVEQLEGSSDHKHSVDCTINPRDFFIPHKEDWVLLSADYSQIEVRLLAHFSDDSSLIELLSIPSGDLFKIITARWTGVPETNVTAMQREHTKRLVYGILYGMGVNALAEQLECSVAEAADKYNRFKVAFPGVANWLKEAVKSCREKGYISTLFGRKRYLDKIKCGNASERSKAERQAVNSICQGSAADLIKVAMIKLVSTEECKKANDKISGKYNLVLQIHDELILEVDRTVVQEVGAWLRSCMENVANLKVPLLVKLKSGPKWGSLQPMDIQ